MVSAADERWRVTVQTWADWPPPDEPPLIKVDVTYSGDDAWASGFLRLQASLADFRADDDCCPTCRASADAATEQLDLAAMQHATNHPSAQIIVGSTLFSLERVKPRRDPLLFRTW